MLNPEKSKEYKSSIYDKTISRIAEIFSKNLLLVSCLFICGCAITPDSIVKQPLTAKPVATTPATATNGSIFNTAGYHPLFEDRRPRFVGDIVTINITENTTATKSGDSSGSKDGKTDSSISSLFGHPVPKASFAASTSNSYADKSAENASNVFTGSITGVRTGATMVVAGNTLTNGSSTS